MFEDYMPIQSLDIEAESKITFDLFVNLPLNNKYILYRKAGGRLEANRLEILTQRNVSNFFIHKKDYAAFVKYVANRMKSLVNCADTSENRKLMVSAAKAILSSTLGQADPAMTNALMGNLNDITAMIIESVLETSGIYKKKTFQKLAALAAKGTDFQKHPVNVSSLAVLITFGIGYNNDRIVSDLAMAALLHDVGLSRIQPRLIMLAHDCANLQLADRKEIHQHPQHSIDILRERGLKLSHMAETIILQHHEEFNGSGYPKGIRGYHLNELAQVVRVADDLDRIINEPVPTSRPGDVAGDLPLLLKVRVSEYLRVLGEGKVIEPALLQRIAAVLS